MPPPPLPVSLSPHVLVLTSPDLDLLLSQTRELPPLHQLLQSFSPLQQVTTRTTGLTSVTHANFNIRFSALEDVEDACKEDEEARAERTMDWIGGRIAQQAAAWLGNPRMVEHERWWTELRACVEGEHVPVRGEGWNHPVALILATSTLAPNPLQAIASLHTRTLELPPWVEQFIFKYTLIVHPTPSNLDPNEAVALLNAVKKQFGLNTHLLQLPSPHDKTKFDVPIPLPQLPSASSQSKQQPPSVHSMSLIMSELDAQNTSRFVREFVTMALIPWMERCVAEWNDAFTNTRRISTRIFGSTARRFFGSSISSPITAPSTVTSSQVASPATGISPALPSSQVGTLPPHRRLAEFATILGDYKLATAVWDVLRKETPTSSHGRALSNGSDILPLVLAGGPALSKHANAALTALDISGSPSTAAQVRALVYAVRWEIGVNDFHTERSDGERWLASAAGTVEEPTSGLLFGRAASVSVRKGATRRAALWYATAARRLEKSGIKPLTIHFFEQANEARGYRKESLLSPSFFAIEGNTTTNAASTGSVDAVQASLNHTLGRLKYSSGDTHAAVILFSGLLRPPPMVSSLSIGSSIDNPDSMELDPSKMYLDDFKDALEHYISTHPSPAGLSEFRLPINFVRAALTQVRLASDDMHFDGSLKGIDDYWASFCRSRGEKGTRLDTSRTAIVNRPFWLNITLQNPLKAEITLANVTVLVAEQDGSDLVDPTSVEAETLALITLPPRGQVTVSMKITARSAISLSFPSLSYAFLALLPCTESLATPGRRLNDTPTQRQSVMYGPDIPVEIAVQESCARLQCRFIAPFEMYDVSGEDKHQEEISVLDGEIRKETLTIRNVGDRMVEDIWLVPPDEGSIWIGEADAQGPYVTPQTLVAPKPHRLAGSSLEPGAVLDVPVIMRHTGDGATTIDVFVVFRENDKAKQYMVTRARRHTWVQPIILLNAVVRAAAASSTSLYSLIIEIENVGGSNELYIDQISAASSTWRLSQPATISHDSGRLPLRQMSRQVMGVDLIPNLDVQRTASPMEHLAKALAAVVEGKSVQLLPHLEPVSLHYSVSALEGPTLSDAHKYFVYSSRRTGLARLVAADFPSIPSADVPHIFPSHTPLDMDIAVSWSIPAFSGSSNDQSRTGLISLADAGDLLALGARDGALKNVLKMAEGGKKSRIMYAETKREQELLLEAIRNCRWNEERCPISLSSNGPADAVVHDFGNGPCVVPLTFIARNESTTSSVQVTLRLRQPSPSPGTPLIQYIGNLTKRGIVPPGGRIEMTAKASTSSPGVFELLGWELTAEVGVEQDGRWIERARHVETDAGEPLEVEIVASSEPVLI